MNRSWKVIFLVVAIIYFISPVDFVPGQIDDIIALGMALVPFFMAVEEHA